MTGKLDCMPASPEPRDGGQALGTLYFECLHSGSGIEWKKIFKFIQKQRSPGHTFNERS